MAAEGTKQVEVHKIVGALERGIDSADRVVASGTHDLTLDFTGCSFISVDGLEWLEELLLRADSSQAKVRFTNVPPTIYKVFKVAHIDSLMRACGGPGPQTGPTC